MSHATPALSVEDRPSPRTLPRFPREGAFRQELDRRVDAYFTQTGLSKRDVPAMYRKTATILATVCGLWALLVFWAPAWYLAIPLAVLTGCAAATIGTCIMHDACHGGYSRHSLVNTLLGHTLDLFGGCSSHIWKTKHNTVHHTWTNVEGLDEDIKLGALARLAPGQRRRPWHRFQHVYIWLLYPLLLPKWMSVDDARNVARGRIARSAIAPFGLGGWAGFFGGKLLFALATLVLPMTLHPPGAVVGLWFIVYGTTGLVLSTTFQLAHCVDNTEFISDETLPLREFSEHQLATTSDFAPDSRFITWASGGLNFQVVHHLYPRICHLHYPAISRILEETARAHGLVYRVHRSLWQALASHVRWLRKMGRASEAASADPQLASVAT
jgi:linoleoyl-CoA desaturase